MARLVAIGDSLTQGFQSLAVTDVEQSFPAMIARSMGLGLDAFPVPDFRGAGGLPFNLEWLARRLEESYGANVSTFEWLRAVPRVTALLDEVEEYWERGAGNRPQKNVDYYNLAVWGFEVADAFQVTAAECARRAGSDKDNWFAPPSAPRERTALRVLNPARLGERDDDTQVGIARRIAEKEGIDHLVVWLGSNNCLGTVVRLKVDPTGPKPPGPFSGKTLWTRSAFRADYAQLCEHLAEVGAKHVYLGTVPHVTIPPITRGVMEDRGRLPKGERYFDYYTRFWIRDRDFDPRRDPRLTKAQAMAIDARIDEYNEDIKDLAKQHGFVVVDLCQVLDRLAVRRNHGKPTYALPPALADLTVRFFEIDPAGAVRNGGLMSLDGVHPTSCGYALVAHEFIQAINKKVKGTARPLDFDAIRKWDLLVSRPPRTLDDVFGMLELLEQLFHMSRWMSGG